MEFFDTFLQKNNISLKKEIKKACEDGLRIMQNSLDHAHNEPHLRRIIENLDTFLSEQNEIKKEDIDFEVLLLAICWHDTWRTKEMPQNIFRLLRDQLYDGQGSKKVFSKYAKEHLKGFSKLEEVKHAIVKHTHPTLLPPKTLEAWIMKDMDLLEEWALERVELLEKYILSEKEISPIKLRVGHFYVKYFMAPKTDKNYHFEWTKKEFKIRKPGVIKYINGLIRTYSKMFGVEPEEIKLKD